MTDCYSVAKATLQSKMSVRLSVHQSVCKTPQQLETIILHHSSFILHHSSFILHHPTFISQLLSFSACFLLIWLLILQILILRFHKLVSYWLNDAITSKNIDNQIQLIIWTLRDMKWSYSQILNKPFIYH